MQRSPYALGGGGASPASARGIKPLHVSPLSGRTPLHDACAVPLSCEEILAALRAAPEAAKVRDFEGALPLHLAAHARAPVEAIRALIKADEGAVTETDPEGRTPLHFALSFRELVKEDGAHPAELLPVGALVRPSSNAPYSLPLSEAMVPGMHAPFGGRLGCVQKVIANTRTPYKVAPVNSDSFGWYEREELVPDGGAPAVAEAVEALLAVAPELLRHRDGYGRLPLHYATGGAVSAELFLRLLRAGAPEDASARDDKGFLPLHYAAMERAPLAKVEALLGTPGAAALWDHSLRATPLYLACGAGAPPECILAIMQKGPQAAAHFSLTRSLPLHLARGLPPAVVEPLLAAFPGAAKERTVSGELPLHCLVSSPAASLESVQLVLGAFPAAVSEKTEAGETALLLACKSQAPLAVVKALHALYPAAVREKNEQGRFPAHLAVMFHIAPVQPALVSFLAIENKIAFKACDSEGQTPLHLAVSMTGAEKEVVVAVAAMFKEVVSQSDNKGNLPLHLAAGSGLSPDVLAILNKDGAAARINGEGNLPLHCFVANEKNAAGVRYLLSVNEAAVRVPNAAGELPLHRACKVGAGVEVVQCLLEAFPGAATALSDDLRSPLHHAAAGQAPRPTVELLLSTFPSGARAAASAKTKRDGYTPLHFAVEKTTRVRLGVVKMLLDAFPEAAQVQTKKHHRTPLFLAAAGAPPQVLDRLHKANPGALEAKELEFGFVPLHRAVINAKTTSACGIAVLVNAWKEGAAATDKDDATALHMVREGTSAATAEILLRANPAAREVVNNRGRLPLHTAAWNAAPKSVVSLLLNEATARALDADRQLPLHRAVTKNQLDVVNLLLDSFPQGVEAFDREDESPLSIACNKYKGSTGRAETVKLLVQRYPGAATKRSNLGLKEFPLFHLVETAFLPADVFNAVHGAADAVVSSLINSEWNLLHFACWGKAPAETLLQIIRLAPTSPGQKQGSGALPLHYGASSKAAMEVLLSASPPDALRTKTTNGNTPLASFVFSWDPKVEAFLAMLTKDRGAASELNNNDATALHIACGLTASEDKDRKPRKLAVVSALLDAYPAATAVKTKVEGFLPLHVACKFRANADIVGALLAKGKGTEKVPDKALSLPLHLALNAGAPHASSAALLKAYPAAASVPDANGRLPLHLALAPQAGNAPEDLVRDIFELHPAAARVRDSEDMEPLARLQKRIADTGSSGAFSGELLGKILLQCLPFDPATGEARAVEEPCFVWHKVLADCDDKLVGGVEEVLRLIPEKVEALAFSCDEHGRRAIDRATPRCKAALIKRLFLCGRFEFKPGPPEHVSATSIVRFAMDYATPEPAAPVSPASPAPASPGFLAGGGGGGGGGEGGGGGAVAAAPPTELPHVCLKFLKHRENFQRELDSRQCPVHGATSSDHIVPVLASFDGTADEGFQKELESRGYQSHPFLLVFPAGDRALSAVIDHERESKDWEAEVQKCAKALTDGLAHLHARGVIHGDTKPRNVVRIGRHNHYKLIDLDASTRIGDAVGVKTSTALAPPELLRVDAAGGVAVRAAGGDDALPAHPSFDMWMLGATLYHMLTGTTLLHASNSDNAADESQLALAAAWSSEDKAAKLAAVEPPRARHLLSLLLSKDPALRPSAERVAQHPFITGKQAVRLSGELPAFDVFISYRVASDAELAETLFNKLSALGLRVWWDKKRLSLGKDWREGFCAGLATSRAFVALLSRGAVAARDPATKKPLAGRNWGGDALSRDSSCDNVLLEHRLALELAHRERGLLELIVPVFVGDESAEEPQLHAKWDRACVAPGGDSVASVDKTLAEELDKQGLGAPFDAAMSTAEVWAALGRMQGKFVTGRRDEALDALARGVLEELRAPKRGAPLTIAAPPADGGGGGGGTFDGAPGEGDTADAAAAAAAAATSRNAELTLALKAVQEEARTLRERVAQADAAAAAAAGFAAAAAAARAEAEALAARLVRAEAAAAAAAPPPPPPAPDPAPAAELADARLRLERVAASAKAGEERLRAAAAQSAARAAALEQQLVASAARVEALEAAAAAPPPPASPAWQDARDAPAAASAPTTRPFFVAASPGGGGSHRSGFSGQGAGLLEQAVSEQQTFSAQLQGQLLVQGQLIMSLQRDVMELRGSLRR